MSRPLAALAALLLPTSLACHVAAADWPQWRGPAFDGSSPETNLPADWNADGDGAVAWSAPLPGPGGGTPVIAGGRLFVTAAEGVGPDAQLIVLAFDADSGKELWRRTAGTGNETARVDEGNSASNSCVTDGEHVWSTFGDGTVACMTVEGEPVWGANLQQRFGEFDIQFGFSSTPVLYDGRLYFQLIHGDGDASTDEARVAALDAATGDTVWERGRRTGASRENEHSYASIMLNPFTTPPSLITHGGDYAIAHSTKDEAEGAELWRLGGLNPPGPDYHTTLRFVASPGVGAGPNGTGMVVVPTAKRGPVFAVDAAAARKVAADAGPEQGEDGPQAADVVGTDAVAWRLDRGTPDVSTPLVTDKLVYLMGERGVLGCHAAATGKELYQERLTGGNYRASPTLADGKLYAVDRDGIVSVVKAGPEFELLGRMELGEPTSASPAVADGTVYFRTYDRLIAVRKK
ncbi:outer membrane protein assembly factor BamB family protein [Alienimonas californiensis]|uniref:Outer membrane biogenesis protein BamB n=1 Tax=Alienimonas californiensis TaxID=2527989 RepID=A0A517PEX5_9PLAN|nr:PQQ-binding-like beta-propeller repeat protein [Alienimonas californiensis]QDT17922.1 outer membrane biogenesis protein BamB [Alienimonas californiensis]